jgi:hypothetical protein
MFDIIFPYSYVALCFGVLLGIGITVSCMGLFSAFILIFCIYLGIIRITPLFTYFNTFLHKYLPEHLSRIHHNIKESFKMSGNTQLEENRYIFMWHPHGVFSTSLFFHTSTGLTNAPSLIRNTRAVVFNALKWLPFLDEIFEDFETIYSEYHSMKEALLKNSSISLSPGGMREMLFEHSALLSRRRGIFKMALETGTPLVPIISVGENNLSRIYSLPEWLQDLLEPYDACVCIPTYKTIVKYLKMLHSPLKDPINSVIGEPILVEKIENPSEEDISQLRSSYIKALKAMYKKEVGHDLQII